MKNLFILLALLFSCSKPDLSTYIPYVVISDGKYCVVMHPPEKLDFATGEILYPGEDVELPIKNPEIIDSVFKLGMNVYSNEWPGPVKILNDTATLYLPQ